MNLNDYLQRMKRARAIGRLRRKSERETVSLRRALLRVHIIQATDSAAWDHIVGQSNV